MAGSWTTSVAQLMDAIMRDYIPYTWVELTGRGEGQGVKLPRYRDSPLARIISGPLG